MKLQCDLFDFAYVPGWYWQLDCLAEMVLPEPWRFREPVYSTKNLDTPILERYIHSILFFYFYNIFHDDVSLILIVLQIDIS